MTVPAIVTVTLNPAIDHAILLGELVPGSVHRARSSVRAAGGKGVNVAGCLSDWREAHEPPIVATGLIGEFNAPTFEEFFAAKGIRDRFVRIPGHTRNNLKLLDESSGDTTGINLPGLSPSAEHLDRLCAVLATEAVPGAILVLSGSLPPGLPPTAYRDLIGQLRGNKGGSGRGIRVVLDTGARPLRAALDAPPELLPWAIKPNQGELEECAGERFSDINQMARAAHALCRRGVGLVVVSRGAEGALFVSERHVLLGRPPVQLLTGTVGAGDALVAGLVAALAVDAEPERVARLALSFAAAKLAQQGPSLTDRDAVLAQMDRMSIERLVLPGT